MSEQVGLPEILQCYDYPFEDFVQDFGETWPLQAVNSEFGLTIFALHQYMASTYLDPDDGTTRAFMLGFIQYYFRRYKDSLDLQEVVETDTRRGLTFEHLLKAAYDLVGAYCLARATECPKPEVVLHRAVEISQGR